MNFNHNDLVLQAQHPLDDLTAAEMTVVAAAMKATILAAHATVDPKDVDAIRFNYITLSEPPKALLMAFLKGTGKP